MPSVVVRINVGSRKCPRDVGVVGRLFVDQTIEFVSGNRQCRLRWRGGHELQILRQTKPRLSACFAKAFATCSSSWI